MALPKTFYANCKKLQASHKHWPAAVAGMSVLQDLQHKYGHRPARVYTVHFDPDLDSMSELDKTVEFYVGQHDVAVEMIGEYTCHVNIATKVWVLVTIE